MLRIFIYIVFFTVFTQPVFAKSFGAKLCSNNPEYKCHVVERGETWQKLFPDETQRDLVMRVNRMNTKIHRGMTIAIPVDLDSADLLDYSPFDKQISPGKNKIIVSLKDLAFAAYDADGILQHWGPVSGGKGYCPDTKRACRTSAGKFTVVEKRGSGCKSTRYPVGKGGAPMPYCMFFNRNFALHGSYEVPGYNASHGCVRLFTKDAQWLNQEFTAGKHTAVIINH